MCTTYAICRIIGPSNEECDMNLVEISGQVRNKDAVEDYIHALAKELNIHRLYTKLIQVKFSNKLDHDALGLCWGDKDQVIIQISKKHEGAPIEFADMMRALAHEMVHAKQYLRGELCGYTHSWKGKKPRKYKYENSPWEIEAYGLENCLYDICWK